MVGGNWTSWSIAARFYIEPIDNDCPGPGESPLLQEPEPGAILDNGCRYGQDSITWDFSWFQVAGATKYHLFVIGPNATTPLIDRNLTATIFHNVVTGYIGYYNGWKWKVRAYVDGSWTAWSETRVFGVEPIDSDCGSPSQRIETASIQTYR